MKEIVRPGDNLPERFESKIQFALNIREMAIIRSNKGDEKPFEVLRFAMPYKDTYGRDLMLVISYEDKLLPKDIKVIFLAINPDNDDPTIIYTSKAKSITIFDTAVQIIGQDIREEYSRQKGISFTEYGAIITRS